MVSSSTKIYTSFVSVALTNPECVASLQFWIHWWPKFLWQTSESTYICILALKQHWIIPAISSNIGKHFCFLKISVEKIGPPITSWTLSTITLTLSDYTSIQCMQLHTTYSFHTKVNCHPQHSELSISAISLSPGSPDCLLMLVERSMDTDRPTDWSRSAEASRPGSMLLDRIFDRLNRFFKVPKNESRLRLTPLLLPRSAGWRRTLIVRIIII